MKYRKLRIAWSVVWGIAAVLLVVLWVRSYWHVDVLQKLSTSCLFIISSSKGRLAYLENRASPEIIEQPEENIAPVIDGLIHSLAKPKLGFGRVPRLRAPLVFAPYWCPVVISGVLAALPWIRWSNRFSLRTLLIATTLVAIVLGLIVAAV